MDKKDQPIEIVGAGPSGMVAAITMAHHGYGVVVHDERSDVGHRFHGDYRNRPEGYHVPETLGVGCNGFTGHRSVNLFCILSQR